MLRVATDLNGTRDVVVVVVGAVGLVGLRAVVVSLPFPFASVTDFTRLLTDFPVTSPSASRLRFCVAASARTEARVVTPAVAAEEDEGGLARVVIRDGRALTFSASLETERVARVTRRVYRE